MGNEREPAPARQPPSLDTTYGNRATNPLDHIAKGAQEPQVSTARKTSAELDAESAEERAVRAAYVSQYAMVAQLGFDAIETAIDSVEELISVPEAVNRSQWRDALQLAVDVALVATASGIGAWVAAKIAAKITAAVVNNAAKETAKTLMKTAVASSIQSAHGGGANGSTPTSAFASGLRANLLDAKAAFVGHWATVSVHLYKMPTADLKGEADADREDARALVPLAERAMLLEWSNFIAKAVHGSMKWDHWDGPHGGPRAVPLEKATPAPTSAKQPAPARSNVDPARFLWGVDTDSPRNEGEYYGVLQVHVWDDGTLVDLDDYGMRLDHVGPQVRARLRELGGLLRDLPLNKAVKVYARHPDNNVAPSPMHGFLITADNYIRRSYNQPAANVDIAERVQQLSIAQMRG